MGARERVVLGRYPVEGSAGIGALGAVYAARDGSDAIAISRITIDIDPPERRAAVLRAVRQRVSARAFVHHPGLVAVRDCVEDGDELYVITERFGGTPLDRVYGARTPHILDWFDGLCEVLTVLHEAGVYSGALAPDACLLDERGRLRLADFGLADAFSTAARVGVRALDGVHFCAPEVLQGTAPDVRSDVYSLGATLQGLLFDRPYTPGANRYLPRPAREFIGWLTAPLPDDRPASLAEVRARWPEARASVTAWSRPSITMTTPTNLQAATALCFQAAGDGLAFTELIPQIMGRLAGRPPVLQEVDARAALLVFAAPPRALLGLVDMVRALEGVPALRVGIHCGAWSAREPAVVERLRALGSAAAAASRGGALAATWMCARALAGADDVRVSGARLVEGEPGQPLTVFRAVPVEAPETPDMVLRVPFASPSGIRLRVTAGDVAGLIVGLPQCDIELGRGDSTNIGADRLTFAEPTISRSQARLEWDERRQGFSLRHEPAATNATLVNNQPAALEELTIGDTVRMGHLVFTLERDPGPGEPGA